MAGDILLGLPAMYIGGVLTVNLLVMMGHGDPKDAAIFNFLVGALTTVVALMWLFGAGPTGNVTSSLVAAQTLLFTFTYFWLGYNWYTGRQDNRALGWYCLFVALNVIPFAYYAFVPASGPVLWILGFNWILWGLAWFSFWVVLGLQKNSFFKPMLAITWVATIVVWISGLGWLLGWFNFSGLT